MKSLISQEAALALGILTFNCPCSLFSKDPKSNSCFGRVRLPLKFPDDEFNHPNAWDATGTFPYLTLQPSVRIHPSGDPKGSLCAGWHGYIRNGILEQCSDSPSKE